MKSFSFSAFYEKIASFLQLTSDFVIYLERPEHPTVVMLCCLMLIYISNTNMAANSIQKGENYNKSGYNHILKRALCFYSLIFD